MLIPRSPQNPPQSPDQTTLDDLLFLGNIQARNAPRLCGEAPHDTPPFNPLRGWAVHVRRDFTEDQDAEVQGVIDSVQLYGGFFFPREELLKLSPRLWPRAHIVSFASSSHIVEGQDRTPHVTYLSPADFLRDVDSAKDQLNYCYDHHIAPPYCLPMPAPYWLQSLAHATPKRNWWVAPAPAKGRRTGIQGDKPRKPRRSTLKTRWEGQTDVSTNAH